MWWLLPVIPTTREAEIGGSSLEASLGKVRHEALSSNHSIMKKNKNKKAVCSGTWHRPAIPAMSVWEV
jgi:hypothetical protein